MTVVLNHTPECGIVHTAGGPHRLSSSAATLERETQDRGTCMCREDAQKVSRWRRGGKERNGTGGHCRGGCVCKGRDGGNRHGGPQPSASQ